MSGVIYFKGADGKWEKMKQEPPPKEEIFQSHLADFPDLLAGDQINPSDPRRWLLVAREMQVPGEEDGAGRWSLDHLFLDQDGIPTLVEVKRRADTRSRREVVAQMLDYAANAAVYWSVDQIQAAFESTCKSKENAVRLLTRFLRPGADESSARADQEGAGDDVIESENDKRLEAYWEKVRSNLQREKIRLIFMADQIAPELKRIVEFLNGQMSRAEVLAVQVARYVGATHGTSASEALVPMVIGQTAEADISKGNRPRETVLWDEELFFQHIAEVSPEGLETVRKIYNWYVDHDMTPRWGKGTTEATVTPTFSYKGSDLFLFFTIVASVQQNNLRVKIPFGTLRFIPPFTKRSYLQELLDRLNRIPNAKLDPAAIDSEIGKFPNLPVKLLKNGEALEQFFETVEWTMNMIQTHEKDHTASVESGLKEAGFDSEQVGG